VAPADPPNGRRFVLVCGGSLGDVVPFVALARALRARGERVVLAASPDYRLLALGERIAFQPVGTPVSFDRPRPGAVGRRMSRLLADTERWVVEPLARNAEELMEATGPDDILVAHPIQPCAPLVAARRRIPWITAMPASYLLPVSERLPLHYPVASLGAVLNRAGWWWFERKLHRMSRQRIAAVWRHFGAGEPRSFLALTCSSERALILTSPVLLAPKRFPPYVTATGLIRWDTTRMWRRAADLQRFLDEGQPPLVFRAPPHLSVPGFADLAAEVCRRLRMRGVLIDFTTTEPGVRGSLFVDRYVPLSVVAPRSAAAVHYGGHGTAAAFVAAGRPAVILPSIIDQFETASVIAGLGAGVRLSWSRLDATRLTAAVRRALDRTDGARALGERLRAEAGEATAAALLTGVADGHHTR
jgi:UDP:flavonoid glycosyltransferase YjiC (YdhE family)